MFKQFYDNIIGKEIKLSEIYDNLTLKYLQIEPIIGEKHQFDKHYFLNNKFIFKHYNIDEDNVDTFDFESLTKNLSFQIILFHMFESFSVLRYKTIKA